MKDILAKIGFITLITPILLVLSLSQAEAKGPKTHKVNCDKKKQTIQKKVDKAKPGDVIEVRGTCNENVVIPEEIHRITLDGQGTATIDGPDPTRSTILVSGKGITIRGFTITGGRNGIYVSRGEAIIESNTVQDTGRQGINLSSHSFARIIDNTINNTRNGVRVTQTSTARIGFTGDSQAARVPRPNTITGNRNGIFVGDTSFADMAFNTISNNSRHGVIVLRGSSARLGGLSTIAPSGNLIQNNVRNGIEVFDSTVQVLGNTITNNGRVGILLRASSAVIQLDRGGPGAADNTPNTISDNGRSGIDLAEVSVGFVIDNVIDNNAQDGIRLAENSGLTLRGNITNVNNGGFGLACTIGAYASGTINTLTGTSGVAVFDMTCIENLSDFP